MPFLDTPRPVTEVSVSRIVGTVIAPSRGADVSISATFTHGDKTETRTRTAVLTFDGGRFATLTVGDQTYEVDLDARKTDRPVRKR